MERIELKVEVDANDPIIVFSSGNYKLEKHSEYDLFYLQSIENSIHQYKSSIGSIKPYLKSNQFYQTLCSYDTSLEKYGYVYLLIDKSTKHSKLEKPIISLRDIQRQNVL